MQLPEQRFLDLAEKSGALVFFDIEALNLKGDYGSVLCVSIKPFGKKPETYVAERPGRDKLVVDAALRRLEGAAAWCGYYSKGFDIPMLRTRGLFHGLNDLEKRPHIDLYFTLRGATNTSRRSQGHLLSWLRLPEEKMTVSASDWAELPGDPDKHMPTMVKRCESDTRGLEALYTRCRHLIKSISR